MSTASTVAPNTAPPANAPAPKAAPPTATTSAVNKSEILLESGTNELEVLVFGVGKGVYGVNVAKVREVILPIKTFASPEQPKSVVGMFNLRGRVLPLLDLHDYLGIKPLDTDPNGRRVIVTEFNGAQCAFRVERVEQIHRLSWKAMRPVPDTGGNHHFAITGITEIDGRLVLMLDFESIFDHISLQDQLHIDRVENKLGIDRASRRIFLSEDSKFIRELMRDVLINSGYTDVTAFTNGGDAWRKLQDVADGNEPRPDVIITDIEMPVMDGLALTREIKSDSRLSDIPVLLFSSLITEDTRHKGRSVGADDQLAKPQLSQVVEVVDKWIAKQNETK